MRQSIYGLDEYEMLQNLAGYILEQPSIPTPPPQIRVQIYVIFETISLVESDVNGVVPVQPSLKEADYKRFQFRPIGQLVPVAAPQPQLNASPTVRTLRPVRSGRAYRITSPPVRGLVTPELAEALETVFEKFAGDRHFNSAGGTVSGGTAVYMGEGEPEEVVPAPISSLYLRTKSGTGSTFYVKESDSDKTGWVAK